MIPSTIRKIALAIRDEICKNFRYVYYLEISSSLYLPPYLFQSEPNIDDFLAIFDNGELRSSPPHIDRVAQDGGFILIPSGNLSCVTFNPSVLGKLLERSKIPRDPAPYVIMATNPGVPKNANSLSDKWFAFPVKSVFSESPHKAMIRRANR